MSRVEREVRAELVAEATLPDRARLTRVARAIDPLSTADGLEDAVDALEAALGGMGQLQPLLADPAVSEVMINSGRDLWVERGGELQLLGPVFDEQGVLALVERILAPLGLHVDRASPVVDARLADGSRVHVVVPPLAVDGPCLTIRRFVAPSSPLDSMCSTGVAELLRWAVRSSFNVVVSGAAAAGKTTLLNALAEEVSHGERIITVEDTAELRLSHPHVVRLEARPPNAEGVGEVSVRDLVRAALRMRPDRILVGEIRGGEAFDMIQAMSTGHDGSLSTCHANGPDDAMRRVEALVLSGDVALPLWAVREHVSSAVDLVVHMGRRVGSLRGVEAVSEVLAGGGAGEGGDLTRPLTSGGLLTALPARRRRRPCSPPSERWLA